MWPTPATPSPLAADLLLERLGVKRAGTLLGEKKSSKRKKRKPCLSWKKNVETAGVS